MELGVRFASVCSEKNKGFLYDTNISSIFMLYFHIWNANGRCTFVLYCLKTKGLVMGDTQTPRLFSFICFHDSTSTRCVYSKSNISITSLLKHLSLHIVLIHQTNYHFILKQIDSYFEVFIIMIIN